MNDCQKIDIDAKVAGIHHRQGTDIPISSMIVAAQEGVDIKTIRSKAQTSPLVWLDYYGPRNSRPRITVYLGGEECFLRYGIAHMFGHHILKHGPMGQDYGICNFFRPECMHTEEEETANYFARCLLMPEERFQHTAEVLEREGMLYGKVMGARLAGIYNVPLDAVRQRGIELGLWTPDEWDTL